MSRALICLFALAATVSAEDFAKWKELLSHRYVTTNQPTAFEGKVADIDACLKVAEDFASPSKYAVYYDNSGLELCQVFYRDNLGSFASKEMTWWSNQTTEDTTGVHKMYVKQSDDKSEDGITDGGIVATIVLSIVFGIILVFCAFVCEEDDSDISGQLHELEKKEMGAESSVEEANAEEKEEQ